ncbi:MAG: hypothetical protein ABF968_15485, partial [Acetobacter sp.]|uniref:hypothetical protein n=1 Tax=Acetobacter sp. TaxID=440 RepID=UPI0039EC338A
MAGVSESIVNVLAPIAYPISKFIHDNHIIITFATTVGTVITGFNSYLNSRHLREQANLQRQIETNRFNLDLFNCRLAAFEEFMALRKLVLEDEDYLP